MSVQVAEALVTAFLAYAGIGIVFAIAFVAKGAARLDPVAAHGTWGFRLLIVPGAAALWPLLALKWKNATGTPAEERNAHRVAAGPALPVEPEADA